MLEPIQSVGVAPRSEFGWSCIEGENFLVAPLQLIIADEDGITVRHASPAKRLIHAQMFHDALETTDRTVMFKEGHLCGALDPWPHQTPLVGTFPLDAEISR